MEEVKRDSKEMENMTHIKIYERSDYEFSTCKHVWFPYINIYNKMLVIRWIFWAVYIT